MTKTILLLAFALTCSSCVSMSPTSSPIPPGNVGVSIQVVGRDYERSAKSLDDMRLRPYYPANSNYKSNKPLTVFSHEPNYAEFPSHLDLTTMWHVLEGGPLGEGFSNTPLCGSVVDIWYTHHYRGYVKSFMYGNYKNVRTVVKHNIVELIESNCTKDHEVKAIRIFITSWPTRDEYLDYPVDRYTMSYEGTMIPNQSLEIIHEDHEDYMAYVELQRKKAGERLDAFFQQRARRNVSSYCREYPKFCIGVGFGLAAVLLLDSDGLNLSWQTNTDFHKCRESCIAREVPRMGLTEAIHYCEAECAKYRK